MFILTIKHRIDIHIDVPAIKWKELSSDEYGERSDKIRQRVQLARKIQLDRFGTETDMFCNAHMQSRSIRRYCRIDQAGKGLLKEAITKLGLSARAYDRILKVARTVADLSSEPDILSEHIAEAIQYRTLDRQMWMY